MFDSLLPNSPKKNVFSGVADVVTVPEISPEIVPGTVVTGQDPDLGTEEDPAIEGDLPQSRGAAATEAA